MGRHGEVTHLSIHRGHVKRRLCLIPHALAMAHNVEALAARVAGEEAEEDTTRRRRQRARSRRPRRVRPALSTVGTIATAAHDIIAHTMSSSDGDAMRESWETR